MAETSWSKMDAAKKAAHIERSKKWRYTKRAAELSLTVDEYINSMQEKKTLRAATAAEKATAKAQLAELRLRAKAERMELKRVAAEAKAAKIQRLAELKLQAAQENSKENN